MNLLKQTLNWANVYHLDPPHKGTYWISVKLRKKKHPQLKYKRSEIYNYNYTVYRKTTLVWTCFQKLFFSNLENEGIKNYESTFFWTRVLTIRFPVIKYFNWVTNILSSFMGSLICTCTSKHLIISKNACSWK